VTSCELDTSPPKPRDDILLQRDTSHAPARTRSERAHAEEGRRLFCVSILSSSSCASDQSEKFIPSQLSDISLDGGADLRRGEARMDVGGCGCCHPIAAVGLYTLIAQHREHVFERRQTFPDRSIGDFAGALVGNALLASTGLWQSPGSRHIKTFLN